MNDVTLARGPDYFNVETVYDDDVYSLESWSWIWPSCGCQCPNGGTPSAGPLGVSSMLLVIVLFIVRRM